MDPGLAAAQKHHPFPSSIFDVTTFNRLPASKVIRFDAAMLMSSPVRGFRPTRGAQTRVPNRPKPVTETHSPLPMASAIVENVASITAFVDWSLVPVISDTSFTSSRVFIFSMSLLADGCAGIFGTPSCGSGQLLHLAELRSQRPLVDLPDTGLWKRSDEYDGVDQRVSTDRTCCDRLHQELVD